MVQIDPSVVTWSVDESERDGRPLLVLLHGVGSHEGDLIGLAPYLPQAFAIASLRAPLPHGDGFSWYPLALPGSPDPAPVDDLDPDDPRGAGGLEQPGDLEPADPEGRGDVDLALPGQVVAARHLGREHGVRGRQLGGADGLGHWTILSERRRRCGPFGGHRFGAPVDTRGRHPLESSERIMAQMSKEGQ